MKKTIAGFSKLTKAQKIEWLIEKFTQNRDGGKILNAFEFQDANFQKIFDGFSENTISNFAMPYGIAPNFIINGETYTVPMVIEESSVVAAASSAAKFWSERGGFHAEILGTQKVGQVHFTWAGDPEILSDPKGFLWKGTPMERGGFQKIKNVLLKSALDLTENMRKRGGGISNIELVAFPEEEHYYQLRCTFETCDSMGANFINTVLENFGRTLEWFLTVQTGIEPTIIMCILSNYTPQCLVRVWVECAIHDFHHEQAAFYAEKFRKAVRIAQIDPYRAVTHNKGIFNGIDAVVLATANDFRAIEACGHAYAARDGQYRSLSHCTIENGYFKFWMDMPLALGTVGGLTNLHPLAKLSLEILGNPSAQTLMQIVAAMGLAQNFAALRSLVTTGIQKGHMKMHLSNILNNFNCSDIESEKAQVYFNDKTVSFSNVREYIENLRDVDDSSVLHLT